LLLLLIGLQLLLLLNRREGEEIGGVDVGIGVEEVVRENVRVDDDSTRCRGTSCTLIKVSTEVFAIRARWRVESSTLVGAVSETKVAEGEVVIDVAAGEAGRSSSELTEDVAEGDWALLLRTIVMGAIFF
jgi:hypothetical protein